MHQPPNVPNFGRPGRGPKLVRGLALAVEPMLTAGDAETHELDDGWTVVTCDGQLSAQFEHTIVITDDGNEILTIPDADVATGQHMLGE